MKFKTGSAKMYYTISEVAEMTGVKAHVLRYWETEFQSLRPRKNRAGNRNYRSKDIKAIIVIKDLLYKQGFTISGARKKFQEHFGNPDPLINQLQIPFADPQVRHVITTIKQDLLELRELVAKTLENKKVDKKVDSA